jgi:type I restriction enzyme S subunit
MKLGCNESLPTGWKWCKANDCMDVRDGTHDSPKYVSEGYPLVTSKNLVNGSIDFSTCTFISKDDHEAISKRSYVDDGDILYAMIGTIGNPVIVNKICDFSIKNVALFKFNNENVLNRYIYHFLNSDIASRQFNNASRGGTQKFVSLGNIRSLQIPLPPLAEQKRIAAILDKADSLRHKNQQTIQLADKFLRAVFLDMFGDPVTNPKGWEVKPLKEQIVHANNGLSRRRKETENEGHIVLRLQDVQYDGIQFEKELNRIKLDDKEALRYKVDVDDILFIRVNGNPDYVGRSAVFKGHIEPVYHNDHLIRIKVGAAYNAEFLSYCLNFKGSRKIISTQIKTSAGQYTISQDGIERLEFFRPPIELQNKFITLKNHTLKVPHHKIDDGLLFNALSQKAFAGEL